MKKIFIAGLLLICFVAAKAQEIVQLPIPKLGKVSLRYMFRNGSICDPAGKEGLTAITTDMIVESGTSKMSSTDIKLTNQVLDFIDLMPSEFQDRIQNFEQAKKMCVPIPKRWNERY